MPFWGNTMKVKLMVSQGFLHRLEHPGESEINLERYRSFRDVFGSGDFGLVLAGDVLAESHGGERANCYTLDSGLRPIEHQRSGVRSDLFLASGFETARREIPSREDLVSILSYVERAKRGGIIGDLVNSEEATLYEDKWTSISELEGNGVRTPRTYHFSELSAAETFIRDRPEEHYIVKHRFGENGVGISRIGAENMEDLPENISDYIFQEEMDIVDERRVIASCGEVLGGRIITDRTRPWERIATAGRKHSVDPHTPTEGEVRDTLRVFDDLGAILGCVDWVTLRDGSSCFLEFNGVGTGYGYSGGVYDLNEAVAESLKAKYLN
jgi:glutathione synthase/RimK-type ligase-like ATP-grasp enzyme